MWHVLSGFLPSPQPPHQATRNTLRSRRRDPSQQSHQRPPRTVIPTKSPEPGHKPPGLGGEHDDQLFVSENCHGVWPGGRAAELRPFRRSSVTKRCGRYIDIYIIYLFHGADEATLQKVATRSLPAHVSGYGAWRTGLSEFHRISQPRSARDPETHARRATSLASANFCFPSSGTCAAPSRDTSSVTRAVGS